MVGSTCEIEAEHTCWEWASSLEREGGMAVSGTSVGPAGDGGTIGVFRRTSRVVMKDVKEDVDIAKASSLRDFVVRGGRKNE